MAFDKANLHAITNVNGSSKNDMLGTDYEKRLFKPTYCEQIHILNLMPFYPKQKELHDGLFVREPFTNIAIKALQIFKFATMSVHRQQNT